MIIFFLDEVNLLIPHSLTILSNGDLCIGDRENGRVLCVNVKLFGSEIVVSKPPYSISFVGRVFAIASYRKYILLLLHYYYY